MHIAARHGVRAALPPGAGRGRSGILEEVF